MFLFEELPVELQQYVFLFLTPEELAIVSRVSLHWYELSQDPLLWKRFCIKWGITLKESNRFSWKVLALNRIGISKNWKKGKFIMRKLNENHEEKISCVKINDEILLTSSWDKTVKIWNSDTLAPIKTILFMNRIECFDYKNDLIACGCTDGDVRIRKLSNNTIKTLNSAGWVSAVELFGDSLISGSAWNMGQLRSWNIETGDFLNLAGPTKNILTVKCCDNFVASGGLDKKVFINDLRTGRVTLEFTHNNSIKCINLHNDHIISGGADGTIRIWDRRASTREPLFAKPTNNTNSPIASVCYGSNYIAANSWNKFMYFLNFDSIGVGTISLPLHSDRATAMAVNSTNSKLVSASCEEVLVFDFEPFHQSDYYAENNIKYNNFCEI